jgi:hypothetical protein
MILVQKLLLTHDITKCWLLHGLPFSFLCGDKIYKLATVHLDHMKHHIQCVSVKKSDTYLSRNMYYLYD